MNWGQLEGKYNQLRASVKEHWRELTGDDWAGITEKRDHLIWKIQTWYGITKEEAEKRFNAWSQGKHW
jgi:uncharacterized protein YjbJ (UPF0337 family)